MRCGLLDKSMLKLFIMKAFIRDFWQMLGGFLWVLFSNKRNSDKQNQTNPSGGNIGRNPQ